MTRFDFIAITSCQFCIILTEEHPMFQDRACINHFRTDFDVFVLLFYWDSTLVSLNLLEFDTFIISRGSI